jgi:exodeoxyribonuclease-5
MNWSPVQDAALVAVRDWLRQCAREDYLMREEFERPVFRLFGYAGTGKTTLARYFAENVDGEVAFAAFTGQAAHVMRNMGCENASTIHQLIYNFQCELPDGSLQFRRKYPNESPSFSDHHYSRCGRL